MNRKIEQTIVHLAFLARHFSAQDETAAMVVFLLEMGVPSSYDGFYYLERAVPLVAEDPTRDIGDVYETVARQAGGSVGAVHIENAIRSAVKVAWVNRDPVVWNQYYLDLRRRNKRPTNAEFISMLAQILILWKGCCRKQRESEVFCK